MNFENNSELKQELGVRDYEMQGSATIICKRISCRTAWKNFLKGKVQNRVSRAEYWWWDLFILLFVLISCLLISLCLILQIKHPIPTILICLLGLFHLYLFIKSIALRVGRLHDISLSGWWILLWFGLIALDSMMTNTLLPFVFDLIIGLIPSSKGTNKYGPEPNEPTNK